MDEFRKPSGAELEANRQAVRSMRMLGSFLLGMVLCGAFYFGLYLGWISFGGR